MEDFIQCDMCKISHYAPIGRDIISQASLIYCPHCHVPAFCKICICEHIQNCERCKDCQCHNCQTAGRLVGAVEELKITKERVLHQLHENIIENLIKIGTFLQRTNYNIHSSEDDAFNRLLYEHINLSYRRETLFHYYTDEIRETWTHPRPFLLEGIEFPWSRWW